MSANPAVVPLHAREAVAKPAELGFDEDRLRLLRTRLEEDVQAGKCDGAVALVARHGKIAFHEAVGYADRKAGQAMTLNNVISTASTFKQLTNSTVLQRVERGQISLVTQVADIIPEYASRGKAHTTVLDLMCHMAGLPFDFPDLSLEDKGNIQAVTAHACELAPIAVPGTEVHYSAFAGHSILAEIVRRLDGGKRPFRQIVTEDLLRPLGMFDTCLGGRADLLKRWAEPVLLDSTSGLFNPRMAGDPKKLKEVRTREDYELPGGGALSTPYDFYCFAEACRRGGEIDGKRVLAPATIKAARTISTGSKPNGLWTYARQMRGWREFPANMGPGFFVRGEGFFPHPFGQLASAETFGGFGAGTNCFWIDPQRDLISVIFRVGGLEETFSVERHQRFSNLVQAAVVN